MGNGQPYNGRPFHSLFLLLEESYRKCSSSLQQQQPRRPLKIPTVLWKLSSRAVLSPGPFFSFFAPCLSVPSISCSQSSSNSRRLLTTPGWFVRPSGVDRKSTVLGMSVLARLYLGGVRSIKKKTHTPHISK